MPSRDVIADLCRLWAPPTRLKVSQWADRNRQLTSESSAETGQWTSKAYQREPMDAISDPHVHTVVMMSATQMLKTECGILNPLGYVIDQDPGPVLIVMPTGRDGESFSKDRVAPMLAATTCLRGKIWDPKGRSSDNTILHKRFTGGHVTVTAPTANGLSSRPIRYLFCDEIDKYPASAGSEGDPISLARKRTATFRNRKKIILTCSPTVAGESRIARAYQESDQREFHVPCPRCGHMQSMMLKWNQVVWDRHLPTRQEQALSARYHCEHEACKTAWNDAERHRAVELGEWRAKAPFSGTAGFWISELYSPWKDLSEIVLDYLVKKDDPQSLKTFINTSLAETWQERGEAPDDEMIWRRSERYELGTVPQRGLFLTAFVDVQDESLHFELKAWGRGKENWSVDYRVIQCETKDGHAIKTSSPEPWVELERLLMRDWPHESGETMPIMALGIDSGFRPQVVYDFAARHPQPAHSDATGSRVYAVRTVVPTKGTDDHLKLIAGVSTTDAARKRKGMRIWQIGTGRAKQEFYDALRMRMPEGEEEPQPGRCHYPYPEREFYRQICSESRVVRENGKVQWIRDPAVRNEPLDTHVGNRAMAELCGISRFQEQHWRDLEGRLKPSMDPRVSLPGVSVSTEQRRDLPDISRGPGRRLRFQLDTGKELF